MNRRRIEDDQNFLVNRSNLTSNQTTSLLRLAEVISPSQEHRFIQKLFGGNRATFQQLAASIESSPDWRTASQHIENYYKSSGINPYRNDAVEFSDLVFKRYFPKEEERDAE